MRKVSKVRDLIGIVLEVNVISVILTKNVLLTGSAKEKRGQALRKLVTLFPFAPPVPLFMGHIGVFGQPLKNRL